MNNNKAPLISVLIPCYNRELYLEECVNSVLNQDFENLEVIISDNNSTDSTLKIAQSFASRDIRVRVLVNESNLGPIPNWWSCLRAATGRFVHWLWSDDYILPKFYSEWQMAFQHNEENDFLYACAADTDHNGKIKPAARFDRAEVTIEELIQTVGDYPCVPVSPAAYILPTKIAEKYFVDNIPALKYLDVDCIGRAIGPDYLMILGATIDLKKITTNSKPLVRFRWHDQSITVQNQKIINTHYTYATLRLLGSKEVNLTLNYRQFHTIVQNLINNFQGLLLWCMLYNVMLVNYKFLRSK